MNTENSQNPFTIGNPFNIEFEEPEAKEETGTEEKEEKVEATPKNVLESAEEAPEQETQEESVSTNEIEIEDILDKAVEFEDGDSGNPENTLSSKDKKDAEGAIATALKTSDQSFDFKETTDRLIKSGFWQDFEGREDMELDQEMFTQLSQQQDRWKAESMLDNIYSAFSDTEKEFLAFKQAGGDLDTYYQSRQKVNSIDNLDITSDEGKINAIYTYYKNFVGWNDEKIKKHINRISKDLDFQEEAETAYQTIQEHVKKQHKQMLDQQYQVQQQKNQAIESFKGDVKKILKHNKVSSSKANKIVNRLTSVDQSTGMAEIDAAYLTLRNDPAKAIMLHDFLMDFDTFVKNVSNQKEEEVKKKVFFDLKKSKKQSSEKQDFSFKSTSGGRGKNKNPFIK